MRVGNAAVQLSSINLLRFTGGSGRVSVPVRPSSTVFAQYRHVYGVPAAAGQQTVSLSKISILNNLIESLQRLKKDPGYAAGGAEPSPAEADSLIRQYSAELHRAVVSTPEPFGTLAGAATSGMVLSVGA